MVACDIVTDYPISEEIRKRVDTSKMKDVEARCSYVQSINPFNMDSDVVKNVVNEKWRKLGVFARLLTVLLIVTTCALSMFDTVKLEEIQRLQKLKPVDYSVEVCHVRKSMLMLAECPAVRAIENHLLDYCASRNDSNFVVHTSFKHGVMRLVLL